MTHSNTNPLNAPVCAECHLGQSGVSVPQGTAPGCFNNTLCHSTGGGHEAGWSAFDVHGPVAKGTPGANTGFEFCKVCHGDDFSGGNTLVSCFTAACHNVPAPHPAKPWRGGTVTHVDTDPLNAPVCAQCHLGQSGVSVPQGTTPGCFNNTLCHGSGNHTAGWSAYNVHGPVAKDAPGASTGFESCKACHGTGYSGGSSLVSCYTAACHNVSAPHPAKPWRGGTVTHVDTDPLNAPVCAQCHLGQSGVSVPQGTTPGCFNNTLCHGSNAAHAVGWSVPDVHGPVAKDAPGAITGFASCQVCHGADFVGGNTPFSCFTAQCHGVQAPHPKSPWSGNVRTHKDTDPFNAPVCAECHLGQSGVSVPQGTAPGCFNNTLCHGSGGGHAAGWTLSHSVTARVDYQSCGVASCHGTDYGGGSTGISCYECHLGGPVAGAGIMHPSRWTDPDSSHRQYLKNLAKDASSCSPGRSGVSMYCHGSGLPNDANMVVAPPYGSWVKGPTCYACHGKKWSIP